ncbi:MAG: dUTP diphosphatase [Proteobacteria bacterium]|nr:dUTP diphosphatase [Pseudomonadota bacterium]MBU1716204.1 dUTP diphosphatase [Pseudomonadota bacterium]
MTREQINNNSGFEVEVEFCWLVPEQSTDLPLPHYHSKLAAGMDVAAALIDPLVIPPGTIAMIPTGFAVAIPAGFEIQVRPRSGLAIKHGITVVNAPGTIDADYRGEVKIGLINLGREPFTINRGDRVAQLVLAPVCKASLKIVAELSKTARQDGGFGHTGI